MARGDGIDRTSARNTKMTAAKVGNAQAHNERQKESYVNQAIVPERTKKNVHFKSPYRPASVFRGPKVKGYGLY